VRAQIGPIKFPREMRALEILGYVSTRGDGLYQITERGKAALIEARKGEVEGEARELFK
jgi:hypothetical protein